MKLLIMNPPQTTKLNDGLVRSFKADQPGIQTAGKSFLGLRWEDTLVKLLFKELKDKTYTDPQPSQSARILERNIRLKQIVNYFDVCNLNYLLQIMNNIFLSNY